MALCVFMLLAGGCASLVNERRSAVARRDVQLENLEADLKRMEARVAGIETAQQRLFEAFDRLQSEDRGRTTRAEERLHELEASTRDLKASLPRMREDIVKQLSKKLAGVLSTGSAGRSQTGYEHTVRTGETLSEIASAYNVSVRVIVEANGLKNPDAIRVGQKLFIPE